MRRAVAPILAIVLAAGAGFARAAEPLPLDPILSIDAGMHTAPIRALGVSVPGDLVITVSDDKTARMWALADGRSLGVLRVPVGRRAEGALHALGLAPDGATALMAGSTGYAWDGRQSLYLARPAAGSLAGRIPNFPVTALSIAFFPDGRRFVVGLDNNQGIAVFDAAKGNAFLGQRKDGYRGGVTGLDVARDGRIVSADFGGTVRLYDALLNVIATLAVPQGTVPGAVAFSPDDSEIAIAYRGRESVDIVSATNLRHLRTTPSGAVPPKTRRGFDAVAWSQADGDVALFAGGSVLDATGRTLLRRWPRGGRGPGRDIPVGHDLVTAIEPVAGGGVVYASATPGWGRLDHEGGAVFAKGPVTLDLRQAFRKGFAASADGKVVEFPGGPDGSVLRFDLADLSLQRVTRPGRGVRPWRKDGPVARARGWENGRAPRIGGRRIALDEHEIARSLAASVSGAAIFLGGDFKLRWLAPGGDERAAIATPATVWAVAGTARDDMVVAALGDGTIRWYGLDDVGRARQLLALFTHADGRRWVAWTPEGFFAHADAGGQDLVGYVKNRNKALSPRWIAFNQLYRNFHRADIVRGQLDTGGPARSRQALAAVGDVDSLLERRPPPDVAVTAYCVPKEGATRGLSRIVPAGAPGATDPACRPVGATTRGARGASVGGPEVADGYALPAGSSLVTLRVTLVDRGGGIGDVDFFLNGRNVGRQGKRSLTAEPGAVAGASGGGPIVFERIVSVDPGVSEFVVRAYNARDVFGESVPIRFVVAAPPPVDRRTLFVLSVGVNKYSGQVNSLLNAVRDAKGFVDTLASRLDRRIYDDIEAHPLMDEDATLGRISSTIEAFASKAGPEDSVLLYFAGHGLEIDDVYYFAPYGVASVEDLSSKGLSHLRLIELLGELRARNVFVFLDTCHAGAFSYRGAANLANETGRLMLAASTKEQEALDGRVGEHGLFAQAVLDGLTGRAAFQDGEVEAFTLGRYVRRRVAMLAKEFGHTQSAEFKSSGGNVAEFPLTFVEKKRL